MSLCLGGLHLFGQKIKLDGQYHVYNFTLASIFPLSDWFGKNSLLEKFNFIYFPDDKFYTKRNVKTNGYLSYSYKSDNFWHLEIWNFYCHIFLPITSNVYPLIFNL